MLGNEKRTEPVKLMLTERELLDASRLAAVEDRTLAEFIRLTLRCAMYGKITRLNGGSEGSEGSSECI